MKPIELTQEQKEQLLEMCGKLFPGYLFSMFHNGLSNDSDEDIIDINNSDDKHISSIHWFEFCMTYLPDKLFELIEEKTSENQASLRKAFNHRCLFVRDEGERFISHPVDYLYEEFKKLK